LTVNAPDLLDKLVQRIERPSAGAVAAFLALLVAVPAVVFWLTDDPLWRAIIAVESGGNSRAFNPATGAAGIAQITQAVVDDCNAILGRRRFTDDDRWDTRESLLMFHIYVNHWAKRYEKETGTEATDDVRARIWNGGPGGYLLPGTVAYWERVREHL